MSQTSHSWLNLPAPHLLWNKILSSALFSSLLFSLPLLSHSTSSAHPDMIEILMGRGYACLLCTVYECYMYNGMYVWYVQE